MNIEQAQNLSRSFGIAFRRCEEQRPVAENKVEVTIVPAIVCAAFSIELGVKALVLASGGSPWGHNLSKLFSSLPEVAKESIIATVGPDREQFTSALNAVANAFDEWRYVYERSETNVDLAFLRALQRAVDSLLTPQSR